MFRSSQKHSRYSALYGFVLFYIILSFLVRLALYIWSFSEASPGFFGSFRIFITGFVYDLGVASFFVLAYSIYLLLLPTRLNNSLFNKIVTYSCFFLATLIAMFGFFAEFSFWDEFRSRFNFIAVDYLVYTYEVVQNINESYPLPFLISGMVLASLLVMWILSRLGVFKNSFASKERFRSRLPRTLLWLAIGVFYIAFINNRYAEYSENRYQNELSKSGVFSFFAAFRANEINFEKFYWQQDLDQSFSIVKNYLSDSSVQWKADPQSLYRHISDTASARKPNVMMITIESLSADFMQRYGNDKKLMPVLDSLCQHSVLFDHMYATGTRTVRGMEALSLAIPPTPGNSIVRRQDNDHLMTVGEIFRREGYDRTFIYGGDGYFDNMNQYFGSNGFDIMDRGRGFSLGDRFTARRMNIDDSQVHFENAWGICDEDLFDAAIRLSNEKYKEGKPFYHFIMTTSNHKPYTYPENCIDIPSGSGRDGAVKYTDYAIGQFLQKARKQPWFANTVFIFVADHCASSAGVNAIDVDKYHIPCLIYNLPGVAPEALPQQCSQIDLYPTLFYLLGWSYDSQLFGKNVYSMKPEDQRAFVATYQKLGYLKGDKLLVLSPREENSFYHYDRDKDEQTPLPADSSLLREGDAWYQTANFLYKQGKLKIRQ